MTSLETKPSEQATSALLRFIVHPPERRSRGVIIAGACCTTCCCCSCCLHALGGLLGASSALRTAPAVGVRHAQTVYWLTLLACTPVSVLLAAGVKGFLWAVGLLLFGLPVIQILASVIAVLWLLRLDMQPSDRKAALATILRITLGTIVGTFIGLALMVVPLLLLVNPRGR